MKTRNAFFVATVMAVALLAGAGLIASAQNVRSAKPDQFAAIILKCRNYGGQQDVAKNPDIINTTRQTIPAGKTLYWKSSDGDSGSVQLDHALAPNGKVGVYGKAGQSYTCSAWMTK
jgi:hypothetical protein